MARGASGSVLGTQFDDFLFASVREDKNGPLSVLSALARLDVDPWQTAAALAQLPRTAAAQRLASLFAGLPDEPSDPDAAARLVAFLPSAPDRPTSAPKGGTARARKIDPKAAVVVLLYLMSMLVVISVQGFGEHRQPSAPAVAVKPPAGVAAPAPPGRP